MMRGFGLIVLAATAVLFVGVSSVEGVHEKAGQTAPGEIECAKCHGVLGPKLGAPVKALKEDIHAQKGITCVECHGGDPTTMDLAVAKSKEKGFLGKPKKSQIPELCNKCHGDLAYMRKFNPAMPVDQLKAYQTSVHGKRFAEGDQKVATCVSCHGAHGILPASHAASPVYPPNVGKTCAKCHANKEYMKSYKIPTDQLQQYLQSVHAELLLVKRDLSAPTCNDCHGNHGAFPPAVQGIHDMCGQCHVNNNAFFIKSPHHEAFDRQGLPECAACHSNHKVLRTTDEMIGDKPPAVCVGCHAAGSKGLQAASQMRAKIEELKNNINRADEALRQAEHTGMEVSEARLSMKEARMALITTRTKVHTFSLKEVNEEADKGIKVAKAGFQTATDVMKEFGGRRLWVILPIIVTLFVAAVLYGKLRNIED